MTENRQETRAEEVARVRSYLASQSMKRTPEQLVEAVREAYGQFLTATAAIPEHLFHVQPRDGEWCAADVLDHVRQIAAMEDRAICTVLERGETPSRVVDAVLPAAKDLTREDMLAALAASREHLAAVVLEADPMAHLDITWQVSEFGLLNWREMLLFARVHLLDHARQMEAVGAALAQQ